MRVEYGTIVDKIENTKALADLNGQIIKRIVLSPEEWAELEKTIGPNPQGNVTLFDTEVIRRI